MIFEEASLSDVTTNWFQFENVFNVYVLWMYVILGPYPKPKNPLCKKHNEVKPFYIYDKFRIQNKKICATEFQLIGSESLRYLVLFQLFAIWTN